MAVGTGINRSQQIKSGGGPSGRQPLLPPTTSNPVANVTFAALPTFSGASSSEVSLVFWTELARSLIARSRNPEGTIGAERKYEVDNTMRGVTSLIFGY